MCADSRKSAHPVAGKEELAAANEEQDFIKHHQEVMSKGGAMCCGGGGGGGGIVRGSSNICHKRITNKGLVECGAHTIKVARLIGGSLASPRIESNDREVFADGLVIGMTLINLLMKSMATSSSVSEKITSHCISCMV